MSSIVSVVIPTYNRYFYLLNAIDSVLKQTLDKIQIIVINDGSTQEEYYKYKLPKGIKQINLKQNQKEINGFSSDAIRNFGIEMAETKYVAFLDDDDVWLEEKLDSQLEAMSKNKTKFSSTDGFVGHGVYDKKKNYKICNEEYYYKLISKKYRNTKFSEKKFFRNNFYSPKQFNSEFINIHNCIITSSVLVETNLIKKVGMFDTALPNGKGDYDCWKKILMLSECTYVSKPLIYYDLSHGDGQQYKN